MYGTIARFRVKPGMDDKLIQQMKEYEDLKVDGYLGTSIYKADAGGGEYYMAVAFRDKASYIKNAEDPAQDKRYQEMVALLQGEPEWHDGDVVYSGPWTNM